jgi:hypothetical protein
MTTNPTSAREALERIAKLVDKRRDDRFAEYGATEPDTNASYYSGRYGETLEALDEEDEEIAAAIREAIANLTPEPAAGEAAQQWDKAVGGLEASTGRISRALHDGLDRLASSPSEPVAGKVRITKEWCLRMAELEEGHEIGAGILHPEAGGPPYASDNWEIQGYKSPAEEIDDMANVGRSLMDRIAMVTSEGQAMAGWSPMDDPAEIITDMANMLDESASSAVAAPPIQGEEI